MKYLLFTLFMILVRCGLAQEQSKFEGYLDNSLLNYSNRNYTKAIVYYDSIISIRPKLHLAYLSRGKSYIFINKIEKGIADLEHAVKYKLLRRV